MSAVMSPPEPSAQDTSEKDKIAVEKADPDELPPGWTIEVKTRKGSRNKYDRYFTDPVTGYVFRSLRDVHRYLKTGVIGRLAKKPKNNDAIDTPPPSHKPPPENESESEGSKTISKSSEKGKSELPQRSSKRLAGITIDTPPPLAAPPPTPPEPKTRHAKRKAGMEADTPLTAPPEAKTHKATQLAGISVDSAAPPPPSSPPQPKTSSQSTAKQPKEAEKIDANADMDNKPNFKQESSILSPPIKTDENQDSHTILPPPTPATLPPASHTNAEQKPPPPINPTIQTTNKHPEKQENPSPPVNNPPIQENPINYSMNDFWTDPCIEFAVKTLTGAIPFGDLNKADSFSSSPPLEPPMEDIWTDPCIEFAVKTLTGAIPVEDTSVQDYLQHQNKPSGSMSTSHGFSLNKKQQDSAKIVVHHQQVSGSNGQCSRPRLFQ